MREVLHAPASLDLEAAPHRAMLEAILRDAIALIMTNGGEPGLFANTRQTGRKWVHKRAGDGAET